MRILVINGPNINMIGIREPEIYGTKNYTELCAYIEDEAKKNNAEIEIFQSNHEGVLIDKIQSAYKIFDGIVINPGAFTHTSVAIMDALIAIGLPTCEVHISDINAREKFRNFSYVSFYAEKSYSGLGFEGYSFAIKYLIEKYSK